MKFNVRRPRKAGASGNIDPRYYRPRLEILEDRIVPSTAIPLSPYQWTPIGPAGIQSVNYGGTIYPYPNSGRIAAVAVDPSDATGQTIYIGAASGGVWKTANGGA